MSIASSEENEFAVALANRTNFWSGAKKTCSDCPWTWSDGSSFGYTFWGPKEPNGGGNEVQCIEVGYPFHGYEPNHWNDHDCSRPDNYYICERAKASEENSIVPSKNNLLGTLEKWGPYFNISFKLKVNSFGDSSKRNDQSLLHFTATDTNGYQKFGERIPAVWVFTDGTLGFRMNIGSIPNYPYQYKWDLSLGWQSVEMHQYSKNEKVQKILKFRFLHISFRHTLTYQLMEE